MDSKQKLLIAAMAVLTLGAGGAVFAAGSALRSTSTAAVDTAFDPVGMRTAKTPPSFALTNQVGEEITLESLKGKVVILTAVYATCHTACPTIITQAKTAVNSLTEAQRSELSIVAITLDPEGDTQPKRAMAAKTHGLEAPLFHYVNGEDPESVLKLVETLGWARAVAGDTGVIGHSNMFLLLDRQGRIAYTISADTGNDWLDQGIAALLAER